MGRTHVTAYKAMPNAKVTAVCDLNEKQGKDLAEFAGCDWYNDGESMLNTVDIDVVDICLPTFLHEQYVLLAAGHKKHVICEKPVTLSLESLDRMIAATKEADVQFAVGQVVRFWPEYVRAKEMAETGKLGTIKYARASRLSEHPAWSEWYRRAENSGGGLFDLHLHDIDYLCYLFGKVKQELIGLLGQSGADEALGEFCIDMLMIAKYFERIGDHATNIAEWVEYSITGIHLK